MIPRRTPSLAPLFTHTETVYAPAKPVGCAVVLARYSLTPSRSTEVIELEPLDEEPLPDVLPEPVEPLVLPMSVEPLPPEVLVEPLVDEPEPPEVTPLGVPAAGTMIVMGPE
jgi:hypothetical protein